MSLASVRTANRVLRSAAFVESATLIHQTQGDHNEYGEWEPGQAVATDVDLVTVPLTGQERQLLPEGLRERNVRRFYTLNVVAAIKPGISDGDLILFNSSKFYRIVDVRNWTGYREVVAVEPEGEHEVPEPGTLGAFSTDWGPGFDV